MQDFPADAVVIVGNEVLVSQIPQDGSSKLAWVPSNSDKTKLVARTKMRMMGSMLMDAGRNLTYREAINEVVKEFKQKNQKDPVVLDAGCGTGILACFAAESGAKKVYACEMNDSIAEIAQKVVLDNGFEPYVRIIPFRTTDVSVDELEDGDSKIRERVDIIITETMDSVLGTEGIIQTIRDAKRRLGTPDVQIIPNRGKIFGRIVQFKGELLDVHNSIHQYNISFRNEPILIHAGCTRVRKDLLRITKDAELFDIDFQDISKEEGIIKQTVRFPIKNEGISHALLLWWDVTLSDSGRFISTSPENNSWQDHWFHSLLLLDDEKLERDGKTIVLDVTLDETTGAISVVRQEKEQDVEPAQTTKKSRVLSVIDTVESIERTWMISKWLEPLRSSLVGFQQASEGMEVALVDYDPGYLSAKFVEQHGFPSFKRIYRDELDQSETLPFLVTCAVGQSTKDEFDHALHFLYRCSNIKKMPHLTFPGQAFIRCALIKLIQLKNPQTSIQTIEGVNHAALIDAWKGDSNLRFPISLYNYEFTFASEELVVVTMDFKNGSMKYSEGNALLVSTEDGANAIVFWLDWVFVSDLSLSFTSPHKLSPLSFSQVQFLSPLNRNSGVSVACDEDKITNRFVFKTEKR